MKDMSIAMVAANYLVDYKLLGSTSTGQKQKQGGSKRHKAVWKPFNQVKVKKGGMVAALEVRTVTTTQNMQQESKLVGCFICQGPQRLS